MENKKKLILENRLKSFRAYLKEKNLDAALVMKRENYLYLSGFTGSSAYLVISKQDAILVTDFRYEEQAQMQAPLFETVKYEGSLIIALQGILKNKRIEKLGFEESYLTLEKYNEFNSKLGCKEFVPLGDVIERARWIKDETELEILKEAVRIADEAFSHILSYLKPGVSELEIAAEIEYFMKKSGASGPSFETIVASGERASLPHGVASKKKLALGEVVTMDYGALYGDYCSDMTRTVCIGTPKEELKKIYQIVLEAQRRATEGAKAGLLGKEIDLIARDIISQAGYQKCFGHGLGHGVGLEIHEEPRLSPSGNIKMQNGMAVTVEPGIYVSGMGGVRIEDIIIIQEDQPQILTKSTKEMIIL